MKKGIHTHSFKELNNQKGIAALERLIHDAEWRIGSHVASCMEIDDYVREQKQKIETWSAEIIKLLEDN
jgi:hypothetical protein